MKKDSEKVLCENTESTDDTVKSHFSKIRPPSKCECCGIITWMDKPLTLQLDHINGKHRDSRIENLRWLCANCHSQTDTFCGQHNWTNTIKATDEEIIEAIETSSTLAMAMRKLNMDTGRISYYSRLTYIIETYNIELGCRDTTFNDLFSSLVDT